MTDTALIFDILARNRATAGLKGAEKDVQSLGSRMSGTFSKLGNLIGGEFGSVLGSVSEGIDTIGEKGKHTGAILGAAGGVAVGLGYELMNMASGPQQAMAQLAQAISNTGGSVSTYRDEIEKTVAAQENFGHSDVDTMTALRTLTQATNDPKAALEQMGLVANLAAAQHISLADASLQVSKIINGRGTRTLAQYGITATKTAVNLTTLQSAQRAHESAVRALGNAQQALADKEALLHGKRKITLRDEIELRNLHDRVALAQNKLKDSTAKLKEDQQALAHPLEYNKDVLDTLSKKLNGQAAASVDNFRGKVDIIKTKLGDWAAQMGGVVGPALTTMGPILMGVGAIIESGIIPAVGGAISTFWTWLGVQAITVQESVASAAATAGAWVSSTAETIAIRGMLVADWISSSAVMVATSIASAAASAAAWIAANAAMILATGGILLAIGLLVAGALWLKGHWSQVWSTIKAWVSDAWQWIKDHITLILTVALGPLGLAIAELGQHWSTIWGDIKTVVSDVWDFVKPIFDKFISGISVITGGIGKVASVIGGALGGAGKVVGGIANFLGGHVPGYANGGTVPGPKGAPMLAVVHGGERVLSNQEQARGAGGSSPLVGSLVVNNYHPVTTTDSIHAGLRQTAFLLGVA